MVRNIVVHFQQQFQIVRQTSLQQSFQRTLSTFALLCYLLIGLSAGFIGCTNSDSTDESKTSNKSLNGTSLGSPISLPSETDPPIEKLTGREVLERMVSAYQQAISYVDQGVRKVHYRQGDQEVNRQMDESPSFSVAFERPNQLRMHCYNVRVISNKEKTYSRIEQLPDQMVVRPTPDNLTLDYLYQDRLLWGEATQKMPVGQNLPLVMLLAENPLDAILEKATEPAYLGSETIGDHLCHRVSVKQDTEEAIFVVDAKNYILRRLEVKSTPYRQLIDPRGQLKDLAVWVDFADAEFNVKILPEAFEPEIPEEAVLVNYFVSEQPPEPISPMLGKKSPEFTLLDATDKKITPSDMKGKVAVIATWASWWEPSIQSLNYFQQLSKEYADNPNVLFYAVNVEAADVPNSALQEILSQRKIELPIIRTEGKSFEEHFDKLALRQMWFVINDEGVVQMHRIGFQPQFAESFSEQLDDIRAGKNLLDDAIREYEQALTSYHVALQKAAVGPTNVASNQPEQNSTSPKTSTSNTNEQPLQFKSVWRCEELKAPGSIQVVISKANPKVEANEDSKEETTLYINEGWQSLAQLNLQGNVLKKQVLDLPDDAAVTYLKTATDQQGKRFYVAASAGHLQAHIFDANWKRLFSHPENPEHDGITDVELVDLDGDGTLELVLSYFGVAGVHAVSLKNERIWVNRNVEEVWSIVPFARPGTKRTAILAANYRGTIVPINSQGKQGTDVVVGRTSVQQQGRFIKYLESNRSANNQQVDLVGVAATETLAETLVGIDPSGKELWTYPVPRGLQESQTQPIRWGTFASSEKEPGCWLLTERGGILHFVSRTGKTLGKMKISGTPTGITMAAIGEKTYLWVSVTEEESGVLEAYEVTMKFR